MEDDSGPRRELSVGVVVTNYETWELTRRCLDAVARLGGADEVIVVDDGSKTPPPPGIEDQARLLLNGENRGLCASLNRGVQACTADVVVLFDSDAYPLVELSGLRTDFAADPLLAVVGFATVGTGGRPTASWEREPDVLGLVLGQRLDAIRRRLLPGSPDDDLSVFTCAMAVRREAFLAAGGFDEAFDWLDLDHDLSMRLRRAGYHLKVRPDLLAFHEGGGAPQATSARVLRSYKNRWLLLRKHGKLRRTTLVRTLVLLRLRTEWLALKLGAALWDRWTEKAQGRRALIRWCAENYR
ncbi:MAG: glycosyltransferase [Thermoanaerobaculia bacterium]